MSAADVLWMLHEAVVYAYCQGGQHIEINLNYKGWVTTMSAAEAQDQ